MLMLMPILWNAPALPVAKHRVRYEHIPCIHQSIRSHLFTSLAPIPAQQLAVLIVSYAHPTEAPLRPIVMSSVPLPISILWALGSDYSPSFSGTRLSLFCPHAQIQCLPFSWWRQVWSCDLVREDCTMPRSRSQSPRPTMLTVHGRGANILC
jgi:hypothetical protein